MIQYIEEDYYAALSLTSNNPQAAALLVVAQEIVALRLLIQETFCETPVEEVEVGPDGRVRSPMDDEGHVDADSLQRPLP